MFKKLLSVVFVLILVSTAFADETGNKLELGLKGGISSYWGDIKGSKIQGAFSGSIYYWFADYFAFGVDGGMSKMEAEDGDQYFQSTVFHVGPMVKVKPFPSNDLNFQLMAGYEFLDIDPKNKNDKWPINREAGEYEREQNAFVMGLGISPFIYEDLLALDVQAAYNYSGTDYLDDLNLGTENDGYFTALVGLSVYLGKPKDTDGDGIPDKQDVDPTHKEDFDGFDDLDGAPDYDNDQDGVLDKYDKAPNEAEDMDGFQDEDGIPDPDNDKDGVLDANDKAPDDPEDMDGFQDEDGAPDLDNDNDGIADADDKCPNEAETMNEYEDKDGCPDVKPEIAVEAGSAMVLEGVNFASGSANLTSGSLSILDKVVRTLTENQNIEVEIRGYTDNTGSYEGNINLSKRRADSVKEYLIGQHIASYRIHTQGLGPQEPIADNSTREGRAKNRRIEFFRIK